MIEKFLNAKHWQLFALMVGVPIVIQIILFIIMFSDASKGNGVSFNFMLLFPVLMIIFIGMFFGWFWSIAIGLQHKVPKEINMKVKKFKFFFFIPLVYILFISVFISGISSGIHIKPHLFPILILPLHLFSMFCIFYCLYFVSKTIKTVELQREVSFGDFAGEFFLLWFYMIGIWIVQPKINKLINTDYSKV